MTAYKKYQIVYGKSPDGNFEVIYNKETENGVISYSYPETFYTWNDAANMIKELELLGDPSDLNFWSLVGKRNDF